MAEANPSVPLRIGVDFGGVLSIFQNFHQRSEDDEHESVEVNMPDAIESLVKLKESGHELYLISYCGRRRAVETKQSLLKAIPRSDLFNELYFVRNKSHKADVCLALGCDIMIDDKLKNLNSIHKLIPTMKLLWFASPDMKSHPPNMIKVESWSDIMKAIDMIITNQMIRHQADSRVLLDGKLHNV